MNGGCIPTCSMYDELVMVLSSSPGALSHSMLDVYGARPARFTTMLIVAHPKTLTVMLGLVVERDASGCGLLSRPRLDEGDLAIVHRMTPLNFNTLTRLNSGRYLSTDANLLAFARSKVAALRSGTADFREGCQVRYRITARHLRSSELAQPFKDSIPRTSGLILWKGKQPQTRLPVRKNERVGSSRIRRKRLC